MLTLALLLLFQTPSIKTGTASDYALPSRFIISGKVVTGLDEPVMVDLHLTEAYTGVSYAARSFANGTFKINDVLLGTYRVTVNDPRFNLYDQQLLLRDPEDTGNLVMVRLARLGESANPPPVDSALYTIDAETVGTIPAKAMDEYNKGVAAIRSPAKNNPADVHFKNAIAAAPSFYEAHLQLGLELRKQKKNDDAMHALEEAARLRPSEPRPLSILGELYWQTEKYDKGVEALSKLRELGKMTPRDHYYLGAAYYRLEKLDKAEEELLAAINTGNDTDPEPFLQLHNVFMKGRQPVRGLAVLDDYLKTFPNDANHPAMVERAKALRQALHLPPGE